MYMSPWWTFLIQTTMVKKLKGGRLLWHSGPLGKNQASVRLKEHGRKERKNVRVRERGGILCGYFHLIETVSPGGEAQ